MTAILLVLLGAFGIGSLVVGAVEDEIRDEVDAARDSAEDEDGVAPLEDIIGTDRADGLEGTDGAETIRGEGGDDFIVARDGDDFVRGGDGNDTIQDDYDIDDVSEMPSGDDTFYGGDGNDDVLSDDGSDLLFGGLGADYLYALDAPGTDAPDTLNGGFGADLLDGDDGDVLSGGGGPDMFRSWIGQETDQAVTITDYEEGETVVLVNQDPDFLGDDPDIRQTRDGDEVRLTANGTLLATVSGPGIDTLDFELIDLTR